MTISVIIPAYNEEQRINDTIKSASPYAYEIIVIDDRSTDNTVEIAMNSGAIVKQQEHNGYIAAIKRGFQEARGDIIITMDADGEHHAADIPCLTAPITSGDVDLVMGTRQKLPRLSEYIINWLTNTRIKTSDSCTGFRAIRKDLALKLDLKGSCTCGTFALEASYLGARIADVPISINKIAKQRHIAWNHLKQFFFIIYWIIKHK